MADHNFQPPSYVTPSNWEHRSIRLASLACAISAISILVALLGMYGQGNRLQVLEQHARETDIARDHLEAQLIDTRKNLAEIGRASCRERGEMREPSGLA